MTMSQGNVVAIAGLNAKTALVDAGAGAGILRIYSGNVPTRLDEAISGGNVQLSQHTMSDPAFAGAVDTDPNALASAGAIASANADATGVATFYRIFDSNLVPYFQGDCGLPSSDAALKMNTVNLTIGTLVEVLSVGIIEREA